MKRGSPERNRQLTAAAIRKFERAIEASVSEMMRFCEATVKLSMQGPQPSPPGQPPAVGSGALRRAIKREVDTSKPHEVVGRVGQEHDSPAKAYALIQEYGGVIRAKNAPFMVFPIQVATEIGFRDVVSKRSGAVNIGAETYRKQSRPKVLRGAGIATARPGDYGYGRLKRGGVYKWVKAKTVTLPPRPYMRPAFRKTVAIATHILRKHFARL